MQHFSVRAQVPGGLLLVNLGLPTLPDWPGVPWNQCNRLVAATESHLGGLIIPLRGGGWKLETCPPKEHLCMFQQHPVSPPLSILAYRRADRLKLIVLISLYWNILMTFHCLTQERICITNKIPVYVGIRENCYKLQHRCNYATKRRQMFQIFCGL